MQISYHSTLTKIQKLQQRKKKVFSSTIRYTWYWLVMSEIGQYSQYIAGTLGI